MTKTDTTLEFFKAFESADGKLDFRSADQEVDEEHPSISTGSLALDDILGSSLGIALGRLIQLFGPPGSGKTLISLILIKNAQAMDPDAVQFFIDAEGTFSAEWAEQLGCDLSRIKIVENDLAVYGDKCFEMLLGKPKEDAKHKLVGQAKEGLLDKIAKGEINCNLIIYDSIGALIPPIEQIAEIGKQNMAALSRFLTPTFRKLSLAVSKAGCAFVCINHVKATMDQYGPQFSFSGGNSYSHSLSANILFTKVERKDAQLLDANEEVMGNVIRAKVMKSKFGPWPKQCEFTVDFGVGIINQHEEVGALALKYGVVTKPNNVTHEYKEQKWRGEPAYFMAIQESPELAAELMAAVNDARKNSKKKVVSDVVESPEDESEEVIEKPTRGRKKKEIEE